jgi:hypothetical protein
MSGYPHLSLREFYGCCGGSVFGTFPSSQYAIEKVWEKKTQEYYEKINAAQLAQVQYSIDTLVAHDNWAGAFIIAALTQYQDRDYGPLLEKAGFEYTGRSSINTKTSSTMHLYIKYKKDWRGVAPRKRER